MDIIVTLPKSFGLQNWIEEGSDLPGNPWSGEEWHWYSGGPVPNIKPSERVYVCYKGKLRGYAPLVRIERNGRGYALVRHNDAVAVTINKYIQGFRGFRYRFWNYDDEISFPNWMDE
jgi:hypothetical protein